MAIDYVAAAQTIAEDLLGRCQPLTSALEARDMEGYNDNPQFCAALDARVFECVRCGWWVGQDEMADGVDEWICVPCSEDD